MPSRETILVTGAGGFIGGWIVETLYLGEGVHVRAGIRSWVSAARLARFPVEIVLCDVLDSGEITEALSGASRVIHCAKGSDEVIIQGTRNMLEAASRQGVRQFVHISTAEVYGNQCGNVDETYPYQYTGQSYADSKIEAEKLCWEYHAKGLPVTVIRPSIVYGPFSNTWTVNVAQKLLSGNWGIFKGHGDGICNLIYVSDLVSAIWLAARSERAAGEAFNVNGPEAPTWNQYFQRFNAALGQPELKGIEPTRASLRASLMEPVRASAKFARDHFEAPIRTMAASFGPAKRSLKFVEHKLKTTPRLTDFSLYNRQAHYLARKAEDMLGFRPRVDLDAGLKLTVCWLHQLGLVN